MAVLFKSMTLCTYIIYVFVACKLSSVRSEKTHSFFRFTYTDKKSPDDVENSCLVVDNSTLGTFYFGIILFINDITKNIPCKPMKIEEIRKEIRTDKHHRQLCRTSLTMSINYKDCEKISNTLNYLCKNNETGSIYFQECKEVHNFGKEESTANNRLAITMSEFPAPQIGTRGPVYEIPNAHCNLKRSESLTTVRPNITTLTFDENRNDQEKEERDQQSYPLLVVIGSGLAGLLVGVLVTTLTVALTRKCKHSRNENNTMFPDSSVHLRTGIERKFSIHSKEEGTIYHDISDIPGTSKEKKACILRGVSNDPLYDDSTEQRYSESPKSSTSVYENESLSSPASSKNVKVLAKEPSVSIQSTQVYHTLSKDDNGSSIKKEMPASDLLYVQKLSGQKVSISSPVNDKEQHIERNLNNSLRSEGNGHCTKTDNDSYLENPQESDETLQCVYHVLQEKGEHERDSDPTDKAAEPMVIDRQEEESISNDGDSRKEYFIIECSKEGEMESAPAES